MPFILENLFKVASECLAEKDKLTCKGLIPLQPPSSCFFNDGSCLYRVSTSCRADVLLEPWMEYAGTLPLAALSPYCY